MFVSDAAKDLMAVFNKLVLVNVSHGLPQSQIILNIFSYIQQLYVKLNLLTP